VTHGNQYLRLPSLWPSSIIASPSCSSSNSCYTSVRLNSHHFNNVMYSKELYACFKCEPTQARVHRHAWMQLCIYMDEDDSTNCKDWLWVDSASHDAHVLTITDIFFFSLAQKRYIQDTIVIRKLRRQITLSKVSRASIARPVDHENSFSTCSTVT
jgi:hypothetical protein